LRERQKLILGSIFELKARLNDGIFHVTGPTSFTS
jgi:hypothetical protein